MDPRVIAGTTLHMMCDPVELRLFGSNYDQDDSTYKRQSTQDTRERDGLLGVGGGLDGTNIDNLLAACVGDALVGKRYYPEDDQSDSKKHYRIDTHRSPSFVLKPKRLPESPSLKEIDH